MPTKYLIFNADDFGFTPDVNAGIIHCHRNGVLRATTLMANGEAFDDAVRLARETPSLDIGCHLVLIQGRSLLTGEELPGNWKHFLAALAWRRLHPYRELRAQMEKMIAAGLRPSHLDTHKHTHVVPQVLSAVIRLAHEFNVPFIRLPFDAGWKPVRLLDGYSRRKIARERVRATDRFLGFRLTDGLSEQSLLDALPAITDGSTEFMCHPGFLGTNLREAKTRLKETRERELAALTSEAIKEELERRKIVLTDYRELAKT